jgi:hypothetical protein
VTVEQVCRALNARVGAWLRRRRGRSDLARSLETIRYHQARNAAARRSRIKHRRRRLKELIAL